jgi:vacuolar protein sorting-associated protein 18
VSVPLSILITDFHFLLLYPDRVCAVSSLDEKLVYEELLALVGRLFVLSMIHISTEYDRGAETERETDSTCIRSDKQDVLGVYECINPGNPGSEREQGCMEGVLETWTT